MPAPASPFTVDALTIDDVDRAYALVRLTDPGCSLEAWRRFASAWRDAPPAARGVLAVFSPRRVIVGLAPWWRQPSLHGAALWAGPLFACEAALQEHVARRLEGALEELRRDVGDAALFLFRAAGPPPEGPPWALIDIAAAPGGGRPPRPMGVH